jgi:hypothetical protein
LSACTRSCAACAGATRRKSRAGKTPSPKPNGASGTGKSTGPDQALGQLAADLDPRLRPATPAWSSPLLRLRSAVGEVQAYLRANAASLVDYARRYLRGQRISTAVVESMVNRVIGRRMAKKQPMPWSRLGAHLLIQIRVAVLDGRLEQVFQRRYPRFEPPGPTGSPRPLKPPRGFFQFRFFSRIKVATLPI